MIENQIELNTDKEMKSQGLLKGYVGFRVRIMHGKEHGQCHASWGYIEVTKGVEELKPNYH